MAPNGIASLEMFKHMTGGAKHFKVPRRVVRAISVFVVHMENLWLFIPAAALTSRKCLLNCGPRMTTAARFFAVRFLKYTKTKLKLTMLSQHSASATAKLSFGLAGRSFVTLAAMLAISEHIRIANWPTIKALNAAPCC